MNCESESDGVSETPRNHLELRKALLLLYRGSILGLGVYNIGRYIANKGETSSFTCLAGFVQVVSVITGPYTLTLLWDRLHDTKLGISLYDFFIERTLIGIESNIEP